MPRYKRYDYVQDKLLPVAFHKQNQAGTFEFTFSYLIDNKVDLTVFEELYDIDPTGACRNNRCIALLRPDRINRK